MTVGQRSLSRMVHFLVRNPKNNFIKKKIVSFTATRSLNQSCKTSPSAGTTGTSAGAYLNTYGTSSSSTGSGGSSFGTSANSQYGAYNTANSSSYNCSGPQSFGSGSGGNGSTTGTNGQTFASSQQVIYFHFLHLN